MGVKKNKNLKRQKIVFTLVLIFIVVIITCALLLAYLYSKNYINYPIDSVVEASEKVESSTASQADIIVINNVLVGGINKNIWVSASKMYDVVRNKEDIEITMFSDEGKLGTYNTASFKTTGDMYYTKTTKYPEPDEYIAVGNSITNVQYVSMDKVDVTDQDISNVKDALGKYRFLNGTVKIVEAYQTTFKNGELGKIYSVISDGASFLGVYSAVVYSYGNKNHLVRYSYVKDTKLSSAWPVYSIKYVIDLNGDGSSELILQETTANEINYLIHEYVNDGKFREILKVSIDI